MRKQIRGIAGAKFTCVQGGRGGGGPRKGRSHVGDITYNLARKPVLSLSYHPAGCGEVFAVIKPHIGISHN